MDYSQFFSNIVGKRITSLKDLTEVSGTPGLKSLAGGFPAEYTMPLWQLFLTNIFTGKKRLAQAAQYSSSQGIKQFRELIQELMYHETGNTYPLEEILVTAGSQQGLAICSLALLNPGDKVILEKPTYIGALPAFDLREPEYKPIILEPDGIDVDGVEEVLIEAKKKREKVGFIYVIPTYQNPGGTLMSLEKRKKLLALAEKYNVLIIDDSPYDLLRFGGDPIPTLKALDKNNRVIALRTFSKTLSVPGKRVAYMVAAKELIQQFETILQSLILNPPTSGQIEIYKTIKRMGIEKYHKRIGKNAKYYEEQKNDLVKALGEYTPYLKLLNDPKGGMFLWTELPSEKFKVTEMMELMKEHGVLFLPGRDFSAKQVLENCTRLCYSLLDRKDIPIAVQRMNEVIRDYAKRKRKGLEDYLKIV